MTLLLFFNLRFLLKIPKFYVFNAQAICYCHVEMVHEWSFEYLVPSLNHFETVKKFFKEGMAGAINDF
jgi:hypothetical protein